MIRPGSVRNHPTYRLQVTMHLLVLVRDSKIGEDSARPQVVGHVSDEICILALALRNPGGKTNVENCVWRRRDCQRSDFPGR